MTGRRRTGQIVVGLLLAAGLPFGGVYRLRVLDQHERALIVAARWGDAHTVQVLLAQGVDPNTRDVPQAPTDWRDYIMWLFHRKPVPNREQYTPALLVAAKNYNSSVVRMLLRAGADPNATDTTGKRALILAIKNRDAETALLMLAKGINLSAWDAQDQTTALMTAVDAPTLEPVVRELLARGVAAFAQDDDGRTALMHAKHSVVLSALLLDKGVYINAIDNGDKTALMQADESVTQLLLQRGANVNMLDMGDETALHLACDNYEFGKVKLLLKYGADCTPAPNRGWNFLKWSAQAERADFARLALAKGIDVNTRDDFRRTALIFAASKGDAETVSLLLEHGADVNAADTSGMTPLMYAAQDNHAGVVQRLLQHGANPDLRDREDKWTAAQRAKRFGAEDVTDLLRTGVLPTPIKNDCTHRRVRIGPRLWLVREPLPHQKSAEPSEEDARQVNRVYLVDDANRQGTPLLLHSSEVQDSKLPALCVFRDVDGRRYVYLDDYDGFFPQGSIYLIKGRSLLLKWSDGGRYSFSCTSLRHGGARICRYSPGRYKYGKSSPRADDSTYDISRFRNGVVKELGTIDSP